jgi:PAS domain S-box-containing protein
MPDQNLSSDHVDNHDESKPVLGESLTEYSLLKTLINQLPDLIYVKDTQCRYLLANDATLRSLALNSTEELYGKTDFDVQPLDMAKQYYADEQAIISTGTPLINHEDPIVDQYSGNIRWQLSTKVPFYNTHGEIAGLVGINRHITKRKRMEAQLMAAHTELRETNIRLGQLNASKDKFFSIVSHDLRSPLTILLGLSELIDDNITRHPPARVKLYTKELRESADKLYALLENLLTWSRVQRNVMEHMPYDLDIHDLASETIELFQGAANQKTITLRNATAPGTQVYADYAMVHTILRNLLSNALKFTPSGGQIEIDARQHDTKEIDITITDTGVGIPEEDLSKLFRIDIRYSHSGTAGEEGTGLGLILCRELVEKNNGTIWAESRSERGTTFHFTLPCGGQESEPGSRGTAKLP